MRKIGGYAAVFGKLSSDLGGFYEVIRPTFFHRSMLDGWPDVKARYQHNDFWLLGTTGGGTLSLRIDDVGLFYEVDPPEHRSDIVELVARGDVRRSSFAFHTHDDDWSRTPEGKVLRTLHSGQLVDVAPVIDPAYRDTSVGVRGRADYKYQPGRICRTDVRGSRQLSGRAAMVALLGRRYDPSMT